MSKYVIYQNDTRIHTANTKRNAEQYVASVVKRIKLPKSKFKIVPLKPPKYRVGQLFYSYQNPTVKRPITKVYPTDDPMWDNHKYKLSLKDKDGYTKSSNYINESSLSRSKLR